MIVGISVSQGLAPLLRIERRALARALRCSSDVEHYVFYCNRRSCAHSVNKGTTPNKESVMKLEMQALYAYW